ncbi:MAG TPA: hypothetical protein VIQ53_04930, partial [Inquilinus sp.]
MGSRIGRSTSRCKDARLRVAIPPGMAFTFAGNKGEDRAVPTPITGRCFCGAVRFRFDQAPVVARVCW